MHQKPTQSLRDLELCIRTMVSYPPPNCQEYNFIFIEQDLARAILTAGVLNCSIMYCESMPCLI